MASLLTPRPLRHRPALKGKPRTNRVRLVAFIWRHYSNPATPETVPRRIKVVSKPGTLSSLTYQRSLLDSMKPILGVNNPADWYKVKWHDVLKAGGAVMLNQCYGGSLVKALIKVYHEHKWNEWQFSQVPRGWWDDMANQTRFIAWFEREEGIQSLDDWYKTPTERLYSKNGRSLLEFYNYSCLKMLRAIYPEHRWLPWRFPRIDKGFWDSPANRKEYFDWLLTDLGLSCTLDDLFKVTKDEIKERRGARLLATYYGDSVENAFRGVYPELQWPGGSVTQLRSQLEQPNLVHHRHVFDTMKSALGVQKPEDWYKVTTKSVINAGGKSIVRHYYDNSLAKALVTIYSDHDWQEWRFQKLPIGWWTDIGNQRRYIAWFEKDIGIKSLEDWYATPVKALSERHGHRLIATCYNGSLLRMLKSIYANHNWIPWKFPVVENGFWADYSNQKAYFDWLMRELDINTVRGLLEVTRDQVKSSGGVGLINLYYGGSVGRALCEIYPELKEELASRNV